MSTVPFAASPISLLRPSAAPLRTVILLTVPSKAPAICPAYLLTSPIWLNEPVPMPSAIFCFEEATKPPAAIFTSWVYPFNNSSAFASNAPTALSASLVLATTVPAQFASNVMSFALAWAAFILISVTGLSNAFWIPGFASAKTFVRASAIFLLPSPLAIGSIPFFLMLSIDAKAFSTAGTAISRP